MSTAKPVTSSRNTVHTRPNLTNRLPPQEQRNENNNKRGFGLERLRLLRSLERRNTQGDDEPVGDFSPFRNEKNCKKKSL